MKIQKRIFMTVDQVKILGTTTEVQSIKEKNKKFDFITIKNFCSLKDTGKWMESQITYLIKALYT